ncbi:MAG: glycosyltransferase family 39 protein [Ardenticatenaceae bacterium]|nr:glycosyltransferase family 39 protein [Ardenticatenaceae bacterium]
MNVHQLNRLILLAALITAAFLRLWQLDTLPLGLYHDEAYNGLDALALIRGETFPIFHEAWELYAAEAHGDRPAWTTNWPIFFEGNYGREPIHVYLMALSIWLIEPTPFAVRLVPALGGVLGVWTTYLAATVLLPSSQRERSLVPSLAAFALAILFPAVHFSRFGLRVMLFVPISTLCVYFFWRGVNTWLEDGRVRWADWILAGLFLGLGLYVYAAGRLFPLLFILFVPLWVWRERSRWREVIKPIALMAAISLAVALPLLLYFMRYPYFFFFRIGYVANRGKGTVEGRPLLTWLYNVPRVLLGLFWRGETHFRHNLPGRPFLDPLQAIAFAWGWLPLGRFQVKLRSLFVALWLFTMLLPTILSGDAPHFGRMTGAMPVIAILIALGVDDALRRLSNRGALIGILGFAIISCSWTVYDYFGRYQNHPHMAVDFDYPDWDLGQVMNTFDGHDLYLTPTQEETATIFFALGDRSSNLRLLNLDQTLVTAGRPTTPLVMAVPQDQPELSEQIRSRLAYSDVISEGGVTTEHQLLVIDTVNPRLTWAEDGNHLFGDTIQLLGISVNPQDENIKVTLTWRGLFELDTSYTAFIHLLDEEGEIAAQVDRPPAGYPTGDWRPEEWIQDTFLIPWPENRPEKWSIRTGFYDSVTLEPLGEEVVFD